ncbi:hypothetical protein SAMN04515671_0648 [Nakamurella panacisegetis]|uniref:Uncharacterized protein n=1 Tax=Nakamurella panacisegetis TaxID=1090615 RepID=A0A1H0ITX7_9ACTN|nr:hypothetical protein [Nakamurella panacisegetis]SDO34908.1 hypothetical protein SAMN04515671_0648 [Nakamurella panacisegetis]
MLPLPLRAEVQRALPLRLLAAWEAWAVAHSSWRQSELALAVEEAQAAYSMIVH